MKFYLIKYTSQFNHMPKTAVMKAGSAKQAVEWFKRLNLHVRRKPVTAQGQGNALRLM